MRTEKMPHSLNKTTNCGRFVSSLLVVSMVLMPLSWAYPPVLLAADGEAGVKKQLALDGYASMLYVLRSARTSGNNSTDSDILTQLRLDSARPEAFHEFHFFGVGKVDLDGDQNNIGFYALEGADDTGSGEWAGYIYEAHVDLNFGNTNLKQVRIGRQSGSRDEPLYFDGVTADFELLRNLQLSVCGGRPVHFYERDAGSDALFGVGVDYSPRADTRVSVDYLHSGDYHVFKARLRYERGHTTGTTPSG